MNYVVPIIAIGVVFALVMGLRVTLLLVLRHGETNAGDPKRRARTGPPPTVIRSTPTKPDTPEA